MNKTKTFKENSILCGLLLIISPIVAATLFCLKDGKLITDIYIPLSGWSDEITYYKQIEAMINGKLLGFFGYNQSKALVGGYATWGPLPLVPYFLFGKIFGWNYLSPVLANILFQMLSFVVLLFCVKPNKKQSLMFSVVYISLAVVHRHTLSGVVESLFAALLVVNFSVCLRLFKKAERNIAHSNEILLLSIYLLNATYMTVTRGYYAVLFLVPLVYCFIRKSRTGIIVSILCGTLSMVLFAFVRKYYCAAYYGNGIASGVIGKIKDLPNNLLKIVKISWYAVRYKGATVPWCYATWLVTISLVIVVCIYRTICDKKAECVGIMLLIMELFLLGGVLLFYSVESGGRHFIAFSLANAIYTIYIGDWRLAIVVVIFGASQYVLLSNSEKEGYIDKDYRIWLDGVEEEMRSKILLTDNLSYENVIGMPTLDYSIDDGSPVSTYYGYMYAIPAGMGMSLDTFDYYEDVSKISASYIMVYPTGKIAMRLEAEGWTPIILREEFTIYHK